MLSRIQIGYFSYFTALLIILNLSSGCSQDVDPLVVYAGKGLKNAVEEIKQQFEQQEGIPVQITYAGSNTLLTTLKNTRKGDIFIPGSLSYIKKAKRLSLVTNDQYVAQHIPSFIVRADNSKTLHVYSNLLAPGVKIAIGNKDMCAIGKVGEAILNNTDSEENFRSNIVVTGSTVNELLHLVKDKEVDAALVWSDMLTWESAGDLKEVSIPGNINKIKEIRVAVLSTSTNPKKASQFADFVSSKGQKIFSKHGFGSK